MNCYILGEEEMVTGFRFAGVPGEVVANREEAESAFSRAVTLPDLKILILTEDVADLIQDQVMAWQLKGLAPLLIEVPGLNGPQQGRKTLLESIREAIGLHI